ncbi:hypothetical protein KP78_27400 [Jeotgalibacillus soli]|uniref:Uncharacterized protein n=1 Tax=Jeotgalibacillus soli TaxID=889306 RepID=A0A0C2V8B1_9BACL|nr:hypothetical protein KP78_27400 [Jeotgalibacillus soli]
MSNIGIAGGFCNTPSGYRKTYRQIVVKEQEKHDNEQRTND